MRNQRPLRLLSLLYWTPPTSGTLSRVLGRQWCELGRQIFCSDWGWNWRTALTRGWTLHPAMRRLASLWGALPANTDGGRVTLCPGFHITTVKTHPPLVKRPCPPSIFQTLSHPCIPLPRASSPCEHRTPRGPGASRGFLTESTHAKRRNSIADAVANFS